MSIARPSFRVESLSAPIDQADGNDGRPITGLRVALLTAGHDRPYVVPLACALAAQGIAVDFVGGDALDCQELANTKGIDFLNLRGDQSENVPLARKMRRLLAYYSKLVRYVAFSKSRILHIIWNNKFEFFDRTILMLYYRSMGKRVVLTAHNVNAARRDLRDSVINRLSLRFQYRLCDHIFVHTDLMKRELSSEFSVSEDRISVIPFGMNDTIPTTNLTPSDARSQLGLASGDKVVLFFGMIVPYKGLETLISALALLSTGGTRVVLVIAGQVKRGSDGYWQDIERRIVAAGVQDQVLKHIGFVPDEDVERYFKAADAVVIPYTSIFQSGVPFLAFNFGLPVIATDVGSLRDDVIEDQTGFTCAPGDPADLARAIERYFASDLFRELPVRKEDIKAFVRERHSWQTVARISAEAYAVVLPTEPKVALEERA